MACADCGVSRKRKYSYSAPTRGRKPMSRARRPTRWSTCRGLTSNGLPSAAWKSSRKAAVSGSQGMTRALAGSIRAVRSG